MADWRAVQAGLGRGFERGFATGGKLGGIGSAIKKVANRLKSQRETGEALETLGQTEEIKQKIKAKYTPTPAYKPTTREEALEFERAKVGITRQPQAIVDPEGQVIGERPFGSVFQPKEDPFQKYFFGEGEEPTLPTDRKSFLKTPEGDRISVVHPDGRRGNIPKSQLQEALQAGFKRTSR
ncbi:hypothetical protein LCGC14_0544490 [marine sediment metagenome]|uniref:Uncharacterized protein n=1 Tax=marine sediment metagenome TaxID=412755 RepID=A0A0F9SA94_9ZZZZ